MKCFLHKQKLVKNYMLALSVFIGVATGFNAYAAPLTYEFKNSYDADGTFSGDDNFVVMPTSSDELVPVYSSVNAPNNFKATAILQESRSIMSGANNVVLFDGMAHKDSESSMGGYNCLLTNAGWSNGTKDSEHFLCSGGDPDPAPHTNSPGFYMAIGTNTQNSAGPGVSRKTNPGSFKGHYFELRAQIELEVLENGGIPGLASAYDFLRLIDSNGNIYWADAQEVNANTVKYVFDENPCINFSSYILGDEDYYDVGQTQFMFCNTASIGGGDLCYAAGASVPDVELFVMTQILFDKPCASGTGDHGSPVPPMYMFAAPSLPPVIMAMKGSSKNAVNFGNSGFAPLGNGLIVGVGYDDATNDYDDASSGTNNRNFDGHDYRIHLDFIKGINERLFWGIAGEYRHQNYNIHDQYSNKFKADYYGPRVDVGWRGQNSFVQLSGTYLWGTVKFRNGGGKNPNHNNTWNKSSNASMAQIGLLGEWDKYFTRHLSLDLGVNAQYVFQHLDALHLLHSTPGPETVKYDDVNYGKVDLNLGLGIDFYRGWYVVPNVGYRWYTDDYVLTGVHSGGADNVWTYNMPNGIRYGVRGGKAMILSGSKWDQLALTAYWDYFKKSDLKQSVWGVLAQYPF